MFSILIMTSFLNVTFIDKILDNQLSAFLGQLSLPLYLNQALIIGICVDHFDSDIPFRKALVFTVLTVILGSLIIKVISETIFRVFSLHTHKLS